jgi:hypothetical protein
MSAYIVDITTIATLAASMTIKLNGTAPHPLNTANNYAELLHAENVASVNYRYSENTAPESIEVTTEHFTAAKAWTMGQQLEVIWCIDYQSCEHPEWEGSQARATLARYRSECIAETHPNDLPHNPGGLLGLPVTDREHRPGFIVAVYNNPAETYTIGAAGMVKNSPISVDVVLLPGYGHESMRISRNLHSGTYGQWLADAAKYSAEPITPAQAGRLLAKAVGLDEEKQQKARAIQATQRQEKARFIADAATRIPDDAKAVIIAELRQDECDFNSDYHGHSVKNVLILAFSKHTRNLFPEMRKAARNAPETLHLYDAPKDAEHRENYSMGGGNYLATQYRHASGWVVKKVSFYGVETAEEKAEQMRIGEWRLPAAPEKTKRKAPTKAPAIVTETPTTEPDTLASDVRINEEKNGIEVEFSDKPSQSTRDKLKSGGFRWSRKLGYWYAKQGTEAAHLAALLAPSQPTTTH